MVHARGLGLGMADSQTGDNSPQTSEPRDTNRSEKEAALENKLDELTRTNSDLHNFIGATAIPILFLDGNLRIIHYTSSAISLFRLMPSDIGRELADLSNQLHYPDIVADSLRVLKTLTPMEREARTDDRWYLVRLIPYRTSDNRIGGVVLAFVDITDNKRAGEVMRTRNEELERFSKVAVGRELRMIELKKEINTLAGRLGEAPRYVIASDSPSDDDKG